MLVDLAAIHTALVTIFFFVSEHPKAVDKRNITEEAQEEHFRNAIACYEKALTIDPNNTGALKNLGGKKCPQPYFNMFRLIGAT